MRARARWGRSCRGRRLRCGAASRRWGRGGGVERRGSYLARADADQVLRDVEAFARRQPWLVAVGGAAAGFFAARFLKASSGARYQARSAGSDSATAQPPASAGERPCVGWGADRPSMVPRPGAEPVLTAQGNTNG